MRTICQFFVALMLGAVSGLKSATPSEVGAVAGDSQRVGAPLESASGAGRASALGVDHLKPQPVGLSCLPAEVTSLGNPSTPFITGQPVSQTVLVSRYVFLSVNAAGTPPLNYQWQSNEVNLLNATNQVLCVRAIAISNAPAFQVVVSNALGLVTSAVARATVSGAAHRPPLGTPGALRVVGTAQ